MGSKETGSGVAEDTPELELIRLAKAGDTSAANTLVCRHLKFVVKVAGEYRNSGSEIDDLVSEGNIGLFKAINGFDETKGCKFLTYAAFWIRQSIMEYLNNTSRTVRLPVNQLVKVPASKRVKVKGSGKLGVNSFVLRNKLDIDTVNPERFIFSDDYMDDTNDVDKKKVSSLLSKLSDRERSILEGCFGIGGEHRTYDEIGKIHGLTKMRVNQIKDSALRKLRSEAHS